MQTWAFHSGPVCIYDEQPRDLLAEIAGQIATEFQRTPVAAAEFGSQPGPHTLRGKETNVWATASTQIFNLTMLGQSVTITATPVAYTWNYGDGTLWGPTPIHGALLHQDRVGEQTQTSHIYTETGRLTISVTTHFDGSYSVNGGPELPIPGQGNIPSPAQPLTVWRAETHLYADDCFANPNGIGC
ncbi:PKD domain-containing protein [Arthrobacter sp. Sr24]